MSLKVAGSSSRKGSRSLNSRRRFVITAMLLVACLSVYEAAIWFGHRHVREQIRIRRIDSAREWLDRLQQFSYDRVETRLLRVRIARIEGRMDAVRTHLMAARGLGCSDDRIHFEQSLTLASEGRLSRVERHLPEFLAGDPEQLSEVCDAFVTGYLRQFRMEEARSLVDVWHRDFPNDAQPLFHSGCIYQYEMRLDEAATAFEKALRLTPHRVEIRERLAVVLVQNLRFTDAVKQYRELLRNRPSHVDWVVGYGLCLFRSGHISLARPVLEEAVALSPKHREARLALAELFAEVGQHEDSLRLSKELYEEFSNDYSIRYLLVRMLRTTGQTDEAQCHEVWLKEAEKIFREISSLSDEVNRRPSDVTLRSEIATRLARYSKYAEAVGWLRAAHQLEPDNSIILNQLVETCRLAGFYDLADLYSGVLSGTESE
jgi:tetratricopeptide (TPR) repeat protein